MTSSARSVFASATALANAAREAGETRLYSANPSGTVILRGLDGRTPLGEIARRLRDQAGAPEGVALDDVLAYASCLVEEGIAEPAAPEAAP